VSNLIDSGASMNRKYCPFNVHPSSILVILGLYLCMLFDVLFFNIYNILSQARDICESNLQSIPVKNDE
jgi:hypothetical protein